MIEFKQRNIRQLDNLGGHYSRNLKAIKSEKLIRPRDIALQLAHKDAVIGFAVNWIKSAIALNKARDNTEQVEKVLEAILQKIADER
ncbi:MAG: hypothetical protein ACJA0N_002607 [Pseudohongiellaceae bacterium]|jgi:hypothetical protein